jgi:hypothetical protein
MSNVPPPRSRAPKRPWYLVAALVAGWVLGANAMNDGCNAIAFYRGEHVDVKAPADAITDVEARANVITMSERYFATVDAAKKRHLPIGVALLLLGAAMVMLSARAMSGRPGARGGLVQVTIVRGALVIASYFIMADERRAGVDLVQAQVIASQHEAHPDKQVLEIADRMTPVIVGAYPVVALVLSSLASVFVVIALTRARSREFFEAAAGSLSER